MGLAGDYCVYFTAKDALKEGFKAHIIEDATRSINLQGFEKAKEDVLSRGGSIIRSQQVLAAQQI